MFRIIKISGDSLLPEYREGDFVLLIKIPFLLSLIKEGDTVIFNHTEYGTLIKRVDRISSDRREIFVIGTHPRSIDSRQFGPIEYNNLLGKVIFHIPAPK